MLALTVRQVGFEHVRVDLHLTRCVLRLELLHGGGYVPSTAIWRWAGAMLLIETVGAA